MMMFEALVAIAVRAIVASVVLGGALALVVHAASRLLALGASTRHALWTTALVAIALMPLASIGVSVWRATPPAAAASATPAVTVQGSRSAALVARKTYASPEHASAGAASSGAVSAGDENVAARFAGAAAFAGWTPRLPRPLALGIVIAWLSGAAIGLGALIASLLRVRGLKKRSSPLDAAVTDELPWLTETRFSREIYLRLSYETETPVAIGFRRAVILIPTELATSRGLAAIEPLILHEHAHLMRRDDWTNLMQRIVERVLWCNPVVWLVGRRIALEREIASDDAVVERTGAAHAYATSLWRLVREMRMPEHAAVAPGAFLTRKQISVRIEQLLDTNRARLRRSPAAALGVALVALLTVGVVATSAPAVELPAAAPAAPNAPDAAAVPAAVAPIAPPPVAAPPRSAPMPHAAVKSQAATKTATDSATAKKLAAVQHELAVLQQRAAVHKVVIERYVMTSTPTGVPRVPIAPPFPSSRLESTIHDAVAGAVHGAIAVALVPPMGAPQVAQNAPGRSLAGTSVTREIIAGCPGCSLRGMDLRGLDLHDLALTGDDFTGTNLSGVNLTGAHLMGVVLTRANLSGANLTGARLTGVELTGANLDGAILQKVRFTGVSLRRVGLRGTALRDVLNNCTGCDLSRLDLHDQDLHDISLSGADLSHANLRGANLANAHFTGVDMSYAALAGANLTGMTLDGCNLAHATLSGAITEGLRLHGTDIDW